MSIIDLLFSKSIGKSIDDEIFGKLHFNRMSSQRYWQGKIKFILTNSEVDIYLFDLEDRVTEEHKRFYKELEERYPEIKEKIINILSNPPQWMGRLPQKGLNTFKLVGLSFPTVKELKKSSFQWDMYFSYAPDEQSFIVGLENWKPNRNH
jgi:hypothetical protein